jgi:hypothetical protein
MPPSAADAGFPQCSLTMHTEPCRSLSNRLLVRWSDLDDRRLQLSGRPSLYSTHSILNRILANPSHGRFVPYSPSINNSEGNPSNF